MTETLYWKELTDDGLLKEPKKCGPYYSEESVNGWGGFETEEEAKAQLRKMKKNYPFDVSGSYVLVRVYSV